MAHLRIILILGVNEGAGGAQGVAEERGLASQTEVEAGDEERRKQCRNCKLAAYGNCCGHAALVSMVLCRMIVPTEIS
jgi:hypothetical protein